MTDFQNFYCAHSVHFLLAFAGGIWYLSQVYGDKGDKHGASRMIIAAIIAITNSFGSVSVDTTGARIVSYVPTGGREVLFCSSVPAPDGECEPGFNGGMPVCWPWVYDDWGARRQLHGFARKMSWRQVESTGLGVCALALESSPETKLEWPHDFRLEYRVELRKEALFCSLTTVNTGDAPFTFTEALHPYFLVGDLEMVTLKGLPGGDMAGHEHMKGIFPAAKCGEAIAIADDAFVRTIGLVCAGAARIVVWNCGKDPMLGYAEGDWRRFLCVEPANNTSADAIRLLPGENHVMRFAVTVRNGGWRGWR